MNAPRSPFWDVLLVTLLGGLLGACDVVSSDSPSTPPEQCTLSDQKLGDRGTARDAIPALTNPPLADADAEGASYLSDGDRVIGLLASDTPLAVPHSILQHHEVVNLDGWGGDSLAVTYCPFTGSSLAFDRGTVNGAEFGVSGLLLHENLIMYDRRTNESLWPQMSLGARCGPETGTSLSTLPVIVLPWGLWHRLHPDTKVLSANTGFERSYASTPHRATATAQSSDDEPTPRERILGLPEDPALALPFETLDDGTARRVLRIRRANASIVVFWHRAGRSAMAFRPRVDGTALSFKVRDGRIVDTTTESTWSIDGRAVEGPKAGARLPPVNTAHVAFWNAWKNFHPETQLWTGDS